MKMEIELPLAATIGPVDLSEYSMRYAEVTEGFWAWQLMDETNPPIGPLVLDRGFAITRGEARAAAFRSFCCFITQRIEALQFDDWFKSLVAPGLSEANRKQSGATTMAGIIRDGGFWDRDDRVEEPPTRVMDLSSTGTGAAYAATPKAAMDARQAVQMARVIEDDPTAPHSDQHQVQRQLEALSQRVRGLCMLLGLEP